MKTIGNLLKEARVTKGLSRGQLGEMTHIKVAFILAIETADWGNLPEFSTTLGFVKSISHFLNIDENQTLSVFRRDYPPTLREKKEQEKTKGIENKFRWGPRITFFAGIFIILLIVLGYLGFQYRKFNLAPSLTINKPTEGQIVSSSTVEVSGKTDPDATIEVNGQTALVDNSGNFDTQIDVSKDKNQITIITKSRSGKETQIQRTIKFAQ